jgi:predicted esterase
MILVPATVHGRVFIEPDEHAAVSLRTIVGFHGYAQTGADMMADLRSIPGTDKWTRVSIQALNRFYIRGDAQVVSSWMTREDRETAITDNIAYVDAVLRTGAPEHESTRALVYVGFSQGAAMAYRAALLGARPAAGVIALAGDLPPELKVEGNTRQPWPKVLIGVGTKEQWYSSDKVDSDLGFLAARGIAHSMVRFEGGHEWTDEFRNAAGEFLAAL